MRSFKSNLKAISPIFATLILIAIAVIAGVVVYMFTSGFLAANSSSTNAAQEKVTVQGFAIDDTGAFTVYAQSTNNLDVTVNSIIIKDGTGSTIGIYDLGDVTDGSNKLPKAGTITQIDGDIILPAGVTELTGAFTATLTTSSGGSFVSPSAVASSTTT
jgi:flagellin-like protein